MKLVITFLLLICLSTNGHTCSCRWGGDFFDVSSNASLIVFVNVEKHGFTGKNMKIEILTTYKGKTRKRLKVWGDNGIQCRPYIDLFGDDKKYILAINKSKNGQFYLSKCGEYFLEVEGDTVKSFGHYSINNKRIGKMPFDQFIEKLTNMLAGP